MKAPSEEIYGKSMQWSNFKIAIAANFKIIDDSVAMACLLYTSDAADE